ncbi:MAG: class I SAM-dependent methyltransferase, partial [Nitrospirae bacterium]|nr:class I SAM-dependent methyltransferase [Nitrospirota bacterium]
TGSIATDLSNISITNSTGLKTLAYGVTLGGKQEIIKVNNLVFPNSTNIANFDSNGQIHNGFIQDNNGAVVQVKDGQVVHPEARATQERNRDYYRGMNGSFWKGTAYKIAGAIRTINIDPEERKEGFRMMEEGFAQIEESEFFNATAAGDFKHVGRMVVNEGVSGVSSFIGLSSVALFGRWDFGARWAQEWGNFARNVRNDTLNTRYETAITDSVGAGELAVYGGLFAANAFFAGKAVAGLGAAAYSRSLSALGISSLVGAGSMDFTGLVTTQVARQGLRGITKAVIVNEAISYGLPNAISLASSGEWIGGSPVSGANLALLGAGAAGALGRGIAGASVTRAVVSEALLWGRTNAVVSAAANAWHNQGGNLTARHIAVSFGEGALAGAAFAGAVKGYGWARGRGMGIGQVTGLTERLGAGILGSRSVAPWVRQTVGISVLGTTTAGATVGYNFLSNVVHGDKWSNNLGRNVVRNAMIAVAAPLAIKALPLAAKLPSLARSSLGGGAFGGFSYVQMTRPQERSLSGFALFVSTGMFGGAVYRLGASFLGKVFRQAAKTETAVVTETAKAAEEAVVAESTAASVTERVAVSEAGAPQLTRWQSVKQKVSIAEEKVYGAIGRAARWDVGKAAANTWAGRIVIKAGGMARNAGVAVASKAGRAQEAAAEYLGATRAVRFSRNAYVRIAPAAAGAGALVFRPSFVFAFGSNDKAAPAAAMFFTRRMQELAQKDTEYSHKFKAWLYPIFGTLLIDMSRLVSFSSKRSNELAAEKALLLSLQTDYFYNYGKDGLFKTIALDSTSKFALTFLDAASGMLYLNTAKQAVTHPIDTLTGLFGSGKDEQGDGKPVENRKVDYANLVAQYLGFSWGVRTNTSVLDKAVKKYAADRPVVGRAWDVVSSGLKSSPKVLIGLVGTDLLLSTVTGNYNQAVVKASRGFHASMESAIAYSFIFKGLSYGYKQVKFDIHSGLKAHPYKVGIVGVAGGTGLYYTGKYINSNAKNDANRAFGNVLSNIGLFTVALGASTALSGLRNSSRVADYIKSIETAGRRTSGSGILGSIVHAAGSSYFVASAGMYGLGILAEKTDHPTLSRFFTAAAMGVALVGAGKTVYSRAFGVNAARFGFAASESTLAGLRIMTLSNVVFNPLIMWVSNNRGLDTRKHDITRYLARHAKPDFGKDWRWAVSIGVLWTVSKGIYKTAKAKFRYMQPEVESGVRPVAGESVVPNNTAPVAGKALKTQAVDLGRKVVGKGVDTARSAGRLVQRAGSAIKNEYAGPAKRAYGWGVDLNIGGLRKTVGGLAAGAKVSYLVAKNIASTTFACVSLFGALHALSSFTHKHIIPSLFPEEFNAAKESLKAKDYKKALEAAQVLGKNDHAKYKEKVLFELGRLLRNNGDKKLLAEYEAKIANDPSSLFMFLRGQAAYFAMAGEKEGFDAVQARLKGIEEAMKRSHEADKKKPNAQRAVDSQPITDTMFEGLLANTFGMAYDPTLIINEKGKTVEIGSRIFDRDLHFKAWDSTANIIDNVRIAVNHGVWIVKRSLMAGYYNIVTQPAIDPNTGVATKKVDVRNLGKFTYEADGESLGLGNLWKYTNKENLVFALTLSVLQTPAQAILGSINRWNFGRWFRAFGEGVEETVAIKLPSTGRPGFMNRLMHMGTQGTFEEVVVEQVNSVGINILLNAFIPQKYQKFKAQISEIAQEIVSPNGANVNSQGAYRVLRELESGARVTIRNVDDSIAQLNGRLLENVTLEDLICISGFGSFNNNDSLGDVPAPALVTEDLNQPQSFTRDLVFNRIASLSQGSVIEISSSGLYQERPGIPTNYSIKVGQGGGFKYTFGMAAAAERMTGLSEDQLAGLTLGETTHGFSADKINRRAAAYELIRRHSASVPKNLGNLASGDVVEIEGRSISIVNPEVHDALTAFLYLTPAAAAHVRSHSSNSVVDGLTGRARTVGVLENRNRQLLRDEVLAGARALGSTDYSLHAAHYGWVEVAEKVLGRLAVQQTYHDSGIQSYGLWDDLKARLLVNISPEENKFKHFIFNTLFRLHSTATDRILESLPGQKMPTKSLTWLLRDSYRAMRFGQLVDGSSFSSMNINHLYQNGERDARNRLMVFVAAEQSDAQPSEEMVTDYEQEARIQQYERRRKAMLEHVGPKSVPLLSAHHHNLLLYNLGLGIDEQIVQENAHLLGGLYRELDHLIGNFEDDDNDNLHLNVLAQIEIDVLNRSNPAGRRFTGTRGEGLRKIARARREGRLRIVLEDHLDSPKLRSEGNEYVIAIPTNRTAQNYSDQFGNFVPGQSLNGVGRVEFFHEILGHLFMKEAYEVDLNMSNKKGRYNDLGEVNSIWRDVMALGERARRGEHLSFGELEYIRAATGIGYYQTFEDESFDSPSEQGRAYREMLSQTAAAIVKLQSRGKLRKTIEGTLIRGKGKISFYNEFTENYSVIPGFIDNQPVNQVALAHRMEMLKPTHLRRSNNPVGSPDEDDNDESDVSLPPDTGVASSPLSTMAVARAILPRGAVGMPRVQSLPQGLVAVNNQGTMQATGESFVADDGSTVAVNNLGTVKSTGDSFVDPSHIKVEVAQGGQLITSGSGNIIESNVDVKVGDGATLVVRGNADVTGQNVSINIGNGETAVIDNNRSAEAVVKPAVIGRVTIPEAPMANSALVDIARGRSPPERAISIPTVAPVVTPVVTPITAVYTSPRNTFNQSSSAINSNDLRKGLRWTAAGLSLASVGVLGSMFAIDYAPSIEILSYVQGGLLTAVAGLGTAVRTVDLVSRNNSSKGAWLSQLAITLGTPLDVFFGGVVSQVGNAMQIAGASYSVVKEKGLARWANVIGIGFDAFDIAQGATLARPAKSALDSGGVIFETVDEMISRDTAGKIKFNPAKLLIPLAVAGLISGGVKLGLVTGALANNAPGATQKVVSKVVQVSNPSILEVKGENAQTVRTIKVSPAVVKAVPVDTKQKASASSAINIPKIKQAFIKYIVPAMALMNPVLFSNSWKTAKSAPNMYSYLNLPAPKAVFSSKIGRMFSAIPAILFIAFGLITGSDNRHNQNDQIVVSTETGELAQEQQYVQQTTRLEIAKPAQEQQNQLVPLASLPNVESRVVSRDIKVVKGGNLSEILYRYQGNNNKIDEVIKDNGLTPISGKFDVFGKPHILVVPGQEIQIPVETGAVLPVEVDVRLIRNSKMNDLKKLAKFYGVQIGQLRVVDRDGNEVNRGKEIRLGDRVLVPNVNLSQQSSSAIVSSPTTQATNFTLNKRTQSVTYPGRLGLVHQDVVGYLQSAGKTPEQHLTIVDLGIGHSGAPTVFEFARVLSDAGYRNVDLIGVDNTVKNLVLARDRLEREEVPVGIRMDFGINDNFLLFPDVRSFAGRGIRALRDGVDLILTANVLGHYWEPEQQKAAIWAMTQALKPEGALVVAGGNKFEVKLINKFLYSYGIDYYSKAGELLSARRFEQANPLYSPRASELEYKQHFSFRDPAVRRTYFAGEFSSKPVASLAWQTLAQQSRQAVAVDVSASSALVEKEEVKAIASLAQAMVAEKMKAQKTAASPIIEENGKQFMQLTPEHRTEIAKLATLKERLVEARANIGKAIVEKSSEQEVLVAANGIRDIADGIISLIRDGWVNGDKQLDPVLLALGYTFTTGAGKHGQQGGINFKNLDFVNSVGAVEAHLMNYDEYRGDSDYWHVFEEDVDILIGKVSLGLSLFNNGNKLPYLKTKILNGLLTRSFVDVDAVLDQAQNKVVGNSGVQVSSPMVTQDNQKFIELATEHRTEIAKFAALKEQLVAARGNIGKALVDGTPLDSKSVAVFDDISQGVMNWINAASAKKDADPVLALIGSSFRTSGDNYGREGGRWFQQFDSYSAAVGIYNHMQLFDDSQAPEKEFLGALLKYTDDLIGRMSLDLSLFNKEGLRLPIRKVAFAGNYLPVDVIDVDAVLGPVQGITGNSGIEVSSPIVTQDNQKFIVMEPAYKEEVNKLADLRG